MRQHFTTITDVTAHIAALDPMLTEDLGDEQFEVVIRDTLTVRYEDITEDHITECLRECYRASGADDSILSWLVIQA